MSCSPLLRRLVKNYTVQRVATATSSFCAVLLAAHSLPVESFGVILQAIFLAKFLTIVNFGAISGYFVSRYSKTGPLADPTPELDARYFLSLITQFVVIGIVLFALSLFVLPNFLPGILTFLVFAPIYACEPIFRDKRWFFVSLLPDFVMAVSLLFLCLLIRFVETSSDLSLIHI